MAWRRGTQNKQAGEIRRGQVKEFLVPSSHETAESDEKVWLSVVATEDLEEGLPQYTNNAYVRLESLPGKMADILKRNGGVFLHAHEHPSAVVRAVCVEGAACGEGRIAMNEAQRLNSRVCLDQKVELTLYRGRHVALDGREAAIGNTTVEIRDDPRLEAAVFEVKPQFGDRALDGKKLAAELARHTFGCLVTMSEVFVVVLNGETVVARVGELRRVDDDDDEDEYRGLVTATTRVYVVVDPGHPDLYLKNAEVVPPATERGDRVIVTCSEDGETFPVRRTLLRPCVALTRVSQAGKGKYEAVASCTVPLDCCTFDRVLLYLEHDERHGGPSGFKFDPTLAAELLQAAEALGIAGLRQACQKVLGSFEDRVRKTPIRLHEVVRRNAKGSETVPRGETFLVLDYMVLDITRWLPEHPGGDRIIPEQALNCDCTVMFEVYHVSRQSFLYLKEFYVGELAFEDRPLLPLPAASDTGGDVKASDAFIDELRRHTPWRLDPKDLVEPTHKSF